MLNTADLLRLEYSPDLTEAGIAYACQHLGRISNRDISLQYADWRQSVIDKAVELALRRYLSQKDIVFTTIATTGAGRLDPYHLTVGGWHCFLQAFWIDSPQVAQSVLVQPECLLQAGAVLPADRIIAWVPGEKDAYIFAYVARAVADAAPDRHAAASHWGLLLPSDWSNPHPWATLGRLELMYRGHEDLLITMGGEGDTLAPVSEQVLLMPGQRVMSQSAYASLGTLHTSQLPTGTLDIHRSFQPGSYQVLPSTWKSLAYPGQTIFLGGFISHADFARRSRRMEAGCQVFPGIQARGKARLLWVRELRPLRELFEPPSPG